MAIRAVGSPVFAPAAANADLRERLLLVVLYVAMLASSIAVIEPSPHDFLMGALALACVIAGVRFERRLLALFVLLLAWNAGGFLSLLNVPTGDKAVQYAATSLYLSLAAVIFGCLLAERTMPRLVTLRTAYVLTAVLTAILGICGYFSAFPHAHDWFAPGDRALGGFKDPNVFGPFLIWPALIVLERMIVRHVRALDLAVLGILLLGIFLCFSRGAWFHLAVSTVVVIALAFLTAPTPVARMRIFAATAVTLAALAALLALALSFDTIAAMFNERFHLINSYDVGEGGRFRLQEFALAAMLQFPNGMGPFEFSRVYGLQQHNVYLQAFMVYGWIGGMSYLLILASTIMVGLRNVLVPTPGQPYLIAAFGAFIGEVLEGFVIDTDHWRHFFLLLGMIWGLSAATYRHLRRQPAGLPQGRMVQGRLAQESMAHVG